MKKIIGIGETILDILFKDGQPVKAVPGGSVFNSMISLGRMGLDAHIVSEVGSDHVGDMIIDFLDENGVNSSSVYRFGEAKSPISLAFLNENNDAEYLFYKENAENHLQVNFPQIDKGDIVLYGSYFVLNPQLRPKVKAFLEYARNNGATLYYDVNFRKNHEAEKLKLAEALIENLEFADIVRGSKDDFKVLYGMDDAEKIYREKIKFYCHTFICTGGSEGVTLFTREHTGNYNVPQVDVVSTVGAGDNFNAGVIYGLATMGLSREELPTMTPSQWNKIIGCGLDFGTHACTLFDNYIEKEWGKNYKDR